LSGWVQRPRLLAQDLVIIGGEQVCGVEVVVEVVVGEGCAVGTYLFDYLPGQDC